MEMKKTLRISWDNVTAMVSVMLCQILGRCSICVASYEDMDYWNIRLAEERLSKTEIAKLLDAVDASQDARIESLPQDDETSRCLGMRLSALLLKRYLGQGWETAFINEDGLYLVNPDAPELLPNLENVIRFGELRIRMDTLKSRQDLLDYLQKNGATHVALMDFCDDYREMYHNELCWPYPTSDGKHLGTFLVLVREGILSLPYDGADKEDYELFCPEDACMCDWDSLKIFLDDWTRFSDDLKYSIVEMMEYLRIQELQEARNEK